MTKKDREWLEKAKANPDRYCIYVDNDCIDVECMESGEVLHTFSEYGYHFAHDLLKHLGCNVDFV